MGEKVVCFAVKIRRATWNKYLLISKCRFLRHENYYFVSCETGLCLITRKNGFTFVHFPFFQQIKIVDSQGSIVPVNTPGEICIRGYCVMMGYWGEKEQTEKTVSSTGWLHSG